MSCTSRSLYIIYIIATVLVAGAFLFVFNVRLALAATYYIDATNGRDPHTGTLVGGTGWTTGISGSGVSFDGSDDTVNLGNSSELKPAQWTVATWVNATSAAANYRGIFLPAYADGYTSGFLLLVDNAGRAAIRFGNGTSYAGSINSGTSILGAWHHVAATFDGTTMRLYVDGVEKNSMGASALEYMASATAARIGFGDGTGTFHGAMDEFRLYDRALSGTELSDLYAGTAPTSGLVVSLPFSEGSGTTTADAVGNDGLSSSTPWKTIERVSTTALLPGDKVLFKRGEAWRESLTVPASGTSDNPITFGAYGSGAKPIINAARQITGWTQYSGNIYVADVGFAVTQLFVDGEYTDIAHYPASGYLDIDVNSTDKTYLTDTDLTLTSGEVVGAEIVIRTASWRIETKTAATYNSGTHQIGFDSAAVYDIKYHYGYYLRNKLWMLDTPGEWHYDASAGKLYLMLEGGDDPDDHLVEASYASNGIYASLKDHFTIEDIDIRNAKTDGIGLFNVTNVTIDRVSVSSSSSDGIAVTGSLSSGVVIRGSEFFGNIESGIFLSDSSDAEISGNTITETGLSGMPKSTSAGIHIYDITNLTVEDNTIERSGYNGVVFSGTGIVIQRNRINEICIVLDDCAGIYTWGISGRERKSSTIS